MAVVTCRIQIRFAWWFHIYCHGVALVAALAGREPDWEKVGRVAARAARYRTLRGEQHVR